MIRRCMSISIMVFLLVAPRMGKSSGSGEYFDEIETGKVNWTTGIITAKGVENPHQKTNSESKERQRALSDAVTNAHGNMLEAVKSIRIDTNTTIDEYTRIDNKIMAKIQDLIKSAEIIKQEYLSDGTVKVVIQMDLYGGFSQLVLPKDIKQVEPIKTVKASSGSPSSENKKPGEEPIPAEKIYSGLIVDARGLDMNPALAPAIRDEEGQEIYGAAFVSREFAVQTGMASYMKDMETAFHHVKVRPSPLVVKGLKTKGIGKSDIIISASNAAKIFGSPEHLALLKNCSVIIIAD